MHFLDNKGLPGDTNWNLRNYDNQICHLKTLFSHGAKNWAWLYTGMCQLILNLYDWLRQPRFVTCNLWVYEDSWILNYKKKESNNQIQYEYFSMKFEIIYIIEKNKWTYSKPWCFKNLILPIWGKNHQLLHYCINRYSCSSPKP